MKRGIALSLLIGLFLISYISAESCSVVQRSACDTSSGWKIVMGLSSETNAHGQNNTIGTYAYVLCCDFEGSVSATDCEQGSGLILRLSDPTNAHAEDPSLSNYPNKVCYENFNCEAKSSCDLGEVEVLSLSGNTNAHIGGAGDYSTAICCDNVCPSGQSYNSGTGTCDASPLAYWSDPSTGPIPSTTAITVDFSVDRELAMNVVNIASVTEVTFKLSVPTLIPLDDESIANYTVSLIGGAGDASFNVLEYLPDFGDPDAGDTVDIYFEVVGPTEALDDPELTLNFVGLGADYCLNLDNPSEYADITTCEDDTCDLCNDSLEATGEIICGEEARDDDVGCNLTRVCECDWNGTDCEAVSSRQLVPDTCDGGIDDTVLNGFCTYTPLPNTDTCDDDNMLNYSWTAVWTPAPGPNPDPFGDAADCGAGYNLIPCPAQIPLPFFGPYQLIVAVIILAVIYFLLSKRAKSQSAKKADKKPARKKVKKKKK